MCIAYDTASQEDCRRRRVSDVMKCRRKTSESLFLAQQTTNGGVPTSLIAQLALLYTTTTTSVGLQLKQYFKAKHVY